MTKSLDLVRRRIGIGLAVVLALGFAGCAAWWHGGARRSGDSIRIPHAIHTRAQVDCLACHEEIYDAKSLTGKFLPKEEKCLECHRQEKASGNCGFCHTDPKRPMAYAEIEPILKLSHADHIARTKEDCAQCHKTLPNPIRTRAMAPTMDSCLACHEHKRDYDQGRCNVCHTDLQRYPLEPLSTYSHQVDFIHAHGAVARASADTCAQCHEQTFCGDCHLSTVSTKIELKFAERVDQDFIHRNDYVTRHAIDAQAEPATCRRCHGSSFCDKCHQTENLSPLAKNPRDPHPPGWSFPGSANFHGPAARHDIVSCAGCHDQGARSICVDCHKVGGIGGDPHPPGWESRHGRGEMTRNSMCIACHQ